MVSFATRYIIGKSERDITQVLNSPISVYTFLLQKRTRQQPSHEEEAKNNKHSTKKKKKRKREEKKFRSFSKRYFLLLYVLTLSRSLIGILFKQIWRQLLRATER